MTFPPQSDDDRLAEFLRHHRAAPPPPASDLEADIMAAIALAPAPAERVGRRRWVRSALAASLLLACGGWVAWRTTVPRFQMATEVDEFVMDTWYASAYGDEVRLPLDTTQPDWLVSVYATPY